MATVGNCRSPNADERTTLTGWLDWQRATVRLKCAGLDDSAAHRQYIPTSPAMTIAGMSGIWPTLSGTGWSGPSSESRPVLRRAGGANRTNHCTSRWMPTTLSVSVPAKSPPLTILATSSAMHPMDYRWCHCAGFLGISSKKQRATSATWTSCENSPMEPVAQLRAQSPAKPPHQPVPSGTFDRHASPGSPLRHELSQNPGSAIQP